MVVTVGGVDEKGIGDDVANVGAGRVDGVNFVCGVQNNRWPIPVLS